PVSAPYASITFDYATQAIGHVRLGYQAGIAFMQSQQLQSVRVTNDGSTMRYYALTYATSGSGSQYQQLKQVQECRNAAKTVCYPATQFTWSAANYHVMSGTLQSGPSFANLVGYKVADIDGDGRQDVVYALNGDFRCQGKTAIYVGFADQTSAGEMTLTPFSQYPTCALFDLADHDIAWYLTDYNGDGKPDLLMGGGAGSHWKVYPGQGRPGVGETVFNKLTDLLAGLTTPITVPTGFSAAGVLLDVNGDGLADFIYPVSGSTSGHAIAKARLLQRQSDGSFAFSAPYQVTFTYAAGRDHCTHPAACEFNFFYNDARRHSAITNDINGDGRADITLVIHAKPTDGVPLSTPASPAFNPLLGTAQATPASVPDPGTFYWYQFTVNSITPPSGSTAGSIHLAEYWDAPMANSGGVLPDTQGQLQVIDLNADGLADLFYQDATTQSTYHALINTGDGYESDITVTGLADTATDFQYADINGDGRVDLLFPIPFTDNYHYVNVIPDATSGNGWGFSAPAATTIPHHSGWLSLIGDFDGDAAPDQVSIQATTSNNLKTNRVNGSLGCAAADDKAICSRYHAHDVITDFIDGHGAKTTVVYQPLTNKGVYQRGSENTKTSGQSSLQANTDFGWGSPVFDVLAPIYVVSEVSSSAPIQGDPAHVSAVGYAYLGALMQSGGRGFLGFYEIFSFDANDAAREGNQYIVTVNAYAQQYPFIGMPESSFTVAFNGSLTRGTAQLDQCAANIDDGGDCFAGAGEIVWPQPYTTGVIVANGATQPACNGPGCTVASVSACTNTSTLMQPNAVASGLFTPQPVAQPVFVYKYVSVARQADLGGGIGIPGVQVTAQTTHTTCYDGNANTPSHGNLLYSRSVTADGSNTVVAQKLTANTYTDNTANWFLGRLSHSSVTFVRPGTPNIVRSSDFTYAPNSGLLTSTEVENNQGAALELLTVYQNDAWGNRTASYTCSNSYSVSSCQSTTGLAQRQSGSTVHRYAKTSYDSRGRYPTASRLPFYTASGFSHLNEQTAQTVSDRDEFGNATTKTGINGLQQISESGALGRPYFAADTTGKASTTTFRNCGSGANKVPCSSDTMLTFRSQTVSAGAATTWTYFDV
ncbi:MAG: VCBS repeat-containing protein, partial [Xanthomonadales bacterium]|nr:VCBS repeat-containing protein [Xanthomonadales bacterium]